MRRHVIAGLLISVIVTGGLSAQGGGAGRREMGMSTCPQLASLPLQPLSQVEKDSLLYTREEEKLARDVYRGLFQKWGTRTFAQIAAAEQRHMDAVGTLLNRYELVDPVREDTPGVFTNPRLRGLYDQLMAQGAVSVTDALKTGARIEDLDIYDLDRAISQADNDDIKLIFGNIKAASHNHIRAFSRQLENLGVAYEAEFISPADLQTILTSGEERGGRGQCGAQGGRGRGQGRRP